MKTTIYISKSKVGKHDDLMLLREMLSTFDCEVTEFIGGTYSDEKLRNADILIVLPHTPSFNKIKVGKGQFCEVKDFDNLSDDQKIFIVTTVACKSKEILLRDVIAYTENAPTDPDKNWTHNFGFIKTNSELLTISSLMERFGIPKLESASKSDSDVKSSTLLAVIGRRKS